MSFDQLHPAVQYHVVNSLGWSSLRPTQLAAIAPIQAGEHCLLLAPTAGGKTEAAVIPMLSRMANEGWTGLSVLYVCPIKALLNNLEPRLSRYAGLLGRRVEVWHGDIAATRKRRAMLDPPDIVLTTPESLEGMLVSTRVDRSAWFGHVRTVIVDELHAVAGDDRGWHLRAVLSRIERYSPGASQRIGLSATVSNPEELLRWFAPSGPRRVVGSSAVSTDADVQIDEVGSLENAALVIARLHRGQKRLVFCDSRSSAEKLGAGLNELGTRTFVSHASLSAGERRQAEAAFAEERDCVIVATSTLELGIDVGDLDRVIQIDAPSSVGSFLQRMGRTGRRAGGTRNCLFLATGGPALLLALGVCRLWADRWVEAVTPPAAPWNVVAQQSLLLLIEHGPMPGHEWLQRVEAAFPELVRDGVVDVLEHLVGQQHATRGDDGLVQIGPASERAFGGGHYRDLMATFSGAELLTGKHGATEIGYLDPAVLAGQGEECVVLLAGRAWRVRETDWRRRLVWLEPTTGKGKARWMGGSREMGAELATAIRNVLRDGAPTAVQLTRRARASLDELGDSVPAAEADHVETVAADRFTVWTYAGSRENRRRMLQDRRRGAYRYDGMTVDYRVDPRSAASSTAPAGAPVTEGDLLEIAGDFKFADLLPPALAAELARLRRL